MDNVLVDRSAGSQNLRRRAAGAGCWRRAMSTSPALPPSAYGFFPYSSAPPGPFIYPPYNFYTSSSLPPLPSNHPGLPPRPPVTVLKHATSPFRTSTLPPRPAAIKHITPTEMVTVVPRKMGEYKRKKPRTPRSAEEPPRAQRRKPLQRAAPLPGATAVTEALDDLEREVTRGFVEDLLHALAPPPSSLPLPTFSLVRAAAAKAPPPCTV
uniref:Uncharacterized protein n=1 Tax=Avena sativa TaxID=4498 RepID=A0ACD5ZPA2_AVESA